MIEYVIAGMDALALMFMLFAVLWGFYNYREEVVVANFWLAYTIAALAIGAYAGLKALEWAGVAPTLLDEIQVFFGTIGATIMVITATICVKSPIKHQIK